MKNGDEDTTFRNCWSRGCEGERIQSSAPGPPATRTEDEKWRGRVHKVMEEATRAWQPREVVPRCRSAASAAAFRSILSRGARWMLDE
jgi:hypothetical protein